MDEYPTYDEWIARFDMDVEKPDMDKLAVPHFDHLPIWANGNAYLMGAKAWKKETDKFVDADTEVTVELVEKDGFYELETNIYEILGDYSNGIITSDILGKAFEPEQRLRKETNRILSLMWIFMEITEEYLLFQDLWRSNDYKDLKKLESYIDY